MYALICSSVLAFAMKVLGHVNIDVLNFSSIHLAITPESPRKWIPGESTTDKDDVNK